MTIHSFSTFSPKIENNVYIAPSAEVIGKVTIHEDSSIWPMAVVRGDVHEISIGRRTNIQDGVVCHVTHDSEYHPNGYPLIIGNEVTVGHQAVLHGCTLEDLCLVGIGSIIMDGARIESRVILGAGSLVTPGKILEGGFLWLGSPAKKIRPLTNKELDFLHHSAEQYVKLKNTYLSLS